MRRASVSLTTTLSRRTIAPNPNTRTGGVAHYRAAQRGTAMGRWGSNMVMATQGLVDACLLTRDGIARCRLDSRGQRGEVVSALLPGENIRAIVPDPLSPNRL